MTYNTESNFTYSSGGTQYIPIMELYSYLWYAGNEKIKVILPLYIRWRSLLKGLRTFSTFGFFRHTSQMLEKPKELN